MNWDKIVSASLRKENFTEDQIGQVITLLAEHRQIAYMQGVNSLNDEIELLNQFQAEEYNRSIMGES
jgi:hypothetical protein